MWSVLLSLKVLPQSLAVSQGSTTQGVSANNLLNAAAAANQNATSRGRSQATSTPNQNSQQQPLVNDLSNRNVIGSGSSRSRNFVPTRSRGRQPNYGDIYHSTNLVTERRSNGPPLISSLNKPRLSRNRTGNGGTSRLTERSRESNLRLSVPNAHHADRHKFSTRLWFEKIKLEKIKLVGYLGNLGKYVKFL